jgi:NADH:ubiquinone oxidoreductase subunit 2 (subunit N)
VAPAPASALLSGILTKSGIFGILVISRNLFLTDADWNTILLVLSLVTMFLGALLALFSVDLKRTLACSSVSQIGFILLGIAMQGFLTGENALATWGTVLHMLKHSLIKVVLFMGAGVVYLGTHALDLNTIRLGPDKPGSRRRFSSARPRSAGFRSPPAMSARRCFTRALWSTSTTFRTERQQGCSTRRNGSFSLPAASPSLT